jgi:hypothetical protein
MWNPFSKKSSQTSGDDKTDKQNMGFVQRLAMKKLASMSEAERAKLAAKVLTPENIQKNKGQLLAAMEQMRASGQMTAAQMEEAKRKLGI